MTIKRLPPPEEQARLLANCDFNIKMFQDLAVKCHPFHSDRLKAQAEDQINIKDQLVAYFDGRLPYDDLRFEAKEKMYVLPAWATKGT